MGGVAEERAGLGGEGTGRGWCTGMRLLEASSILCTVPFSSIWKGMRRAMGEVRGQGGATELGRASVCWSAAWSRAGVGQGQGLGPKDKGYLLPPGLEWQLLASRR